MSPSGGASRLRGKVLLVNPNQMGSPIHEHRHVRPMVTSEATVVAKVVDKA